MQRSIAFFAAAVIALGSLAGCGEEKKQSPDEAKKSMMKAPEPGKDAVKPSVGGEAKDKK